MEIINNNGKRCILWLDPCCGPCSDNGNGGGGDGSGAEAWRVIEEPPLYTTRLKDDTAIARYGIVRDTEMVWINGVFQYRDKDYVVDYDTRKFIFFPRVRPRRPYDVVTICYITGDHDLGVVTEVPTISSTNRPNDTLTLSNAIMPNTELVFVGGVFFSRENDYIPDYPNRKIRFFAGQEPKIDFENFAVNYVKL